jgi:SNF2 family DNA or RNA helicase
MLEAEEIPEDFNELKSWMEKKEEEQKAYAEAMPDIAKEIQADLKAEQELQAQMMAITRKRREKERQRDLIKRQAQADHAAMIQAKRKIETFASERAIQNRLKSEAEAIDKATAGYQWREFAFDHQIDGARRLATARRGILGDKRGLGKSLTSLIWADMLGAKKVIIFAPKDVLNNFEREIKHWTPHRHVAVIGGMPKMQREMFLKLLSSQEQFLILCNYEAWRKDPEFIEYIKNLRADTVIIDEAHNIKEKRTSAYRGIRDIVYADNQCNACGGRPEIRKNHYGAMVTQCSVCLHSPEKVGDFCSVKNILPMTGTAILNKPQDLWTLLNLVDRVLFPSEKAFLEDYCMINSWTGRWQFRPGGEEALIARLGSRFIKRDKNSAGVKFKKQQHVEHRIEFDKTLYPDQWRVMQQIAEFGAIKMAENVKLDVIGILPELLRRRQAITWPQGIKIWERDEQGQKTGRVAYEAPATESIKMDKLMEITEEIVNEDEDRLVIFSQFKEALKEVERRLNEKGISVIRYDGDTTDEKANAAQLDFDGKTANVNRCTRGFRDHPDYVPGHNHNNLNHECNGYRWQVICAHYKKGGVGLNLNSARQMIKLDREWNPGKEDQADGRIDRLDNTMDSIVHTIHVEGTIDAFMDNLIAEKAQVIAGFDDSYQDSILDQLSKALKDGDLL